jgi:hypothetical protein
MQMRWQQERQVLSHLSVEQIEQALKWLDSPVQSPPPPELESLNQLEWYLLDKLLQQLLVEKESSLLQ